MPPRPPLGPPPEPEAIAHSLRLIELIRKEIAQAGGRLPFDRYMELVLYAPGLGYYSAGSHKFGGSGDFVTAPELTPLFGQSLAQQIKQVFDLIGGGELLEFGGGSGRLAADILEELARLHALPTRYLILETSPDLRQRQRDAIAALPRSLADLIRWIDAPPADGFRGMIIANEVVDAMPVHRFRIGSDGLKEGFVAWRDDRFEMIWDNAESLELREAVAAVQKSRELPEGYESEINLRAAPWLREIGGELEAGAILLVDYGEPRSHYYAPQRNGGSLLCHYRHQAHDDPFVYPGLQDITADVDFTALAEAATDGLKLAGYTTQALFLLGCGLDQLTSDRLAKAPEQTLETLQAVKRLTLPNLMGERFKALALTKGIEEPPLGFRLRDLQERL